MRRIGLAVVLALGLSLASFAVEAQMAVKVWRIGVLVTGPQPSEHVCLLALRRGLTDLGYVEGRTHELKIRWGEEPPEESLPRIARELVKLGVDLVVSVSSQGLVQAKPALAAVPVVMGASPRSTG